MGVNTVKISGVEDISCSECKLLHGKKFTISEALEHMPIPVRECKNYFGYCRCIYLPL
jgi:hypothetical protein